MRRKSGSKNCSGSWTLRRESSAAHENSTVVWRDFYTTIYTGWTSHSASSSSCVCWCSSVYTTVHRNILPNSVYKSPTSCGAAICALPLEVVQHDKLWPTSVLVRRPSCLELTARTSATNHSNRPFQMLSKSVFIRTLIALSALQTFCLISWLIYLLTY